MSGKAVSFATPDQRYDVRSIERLIKIALPVSQAPELSSIAEPKVERHGYNREIRSRNKRPMFKPKHFSKGDNFPRRDPNKPQDQGFDRNHRRISYRNDRESY